MHLQHTTRLRVATRSVEQQTFGWPFHRHLHLHRFCCSVACCMLLCGFLFFFVFPSCSPSRLGALKCKFGKIKVNGPSEWQAAAGEESLQWEMTFIAVFQFAAWVFCCDLQLATGNLQLAGNSDSISISSLRFPCAICTQCSQLFATESRARWIQGQCQRSKVGQLVSRLGTPWGFTCDKSISFRLFIGRSSASMFLFYTTLTLFNPN